MTYENGNDGEEVWFTEVRQSSCRCAGRSYPLGVADLICEIQKNIERRSLLKPGQGLLVAVSGGVDSMVLLDVLDRLRVKEGWRVMVAHLNHRLRGQSSDGDERLVRKIAKGRGLPIVVRRTDVRAVAKREKLSIEMAARKARHEFLAEAARERGIRSVAVAHHADDQVELFFLRLFRGSGSEGLAGMKWCNRSPVSAKVELVRPLLNVTKAALEGYALEKKVRFREDATNRSLDIQRNRIRHELLPLLRRHYQSGIASTVLRVGEIVGAEAEYVDKMGREWLKARGRKFAKLPVAMQRRVLQIQLQERGVTAEFELIERLRTTPEEGITVSRRASGRRFGKNVKTVKRVRTQAHTPLKRGVNETLRGTVTVFRDETGIVGIREVLADEFRNESRSVAISGTTGEIEFGGARIEWAVGRRRSGGFPKFRAGVEFFDADKVGSRIVLRHWRPGDRFQPIGMGGSVKVQDLLVNQKVPKELRKGLIVATTEAGELFWVEKLRISERFRLCPETKRRLQWRWQRN